MAENTSLLASDHSFFEDRPFSPEHSKSHKEIAKNSSNAEKTYESLNSEIKKVTESSKDLSEVSGSAYPQCPEPLIDMNIWHLNKNENQQEAASKYYNKFEALKKQSQLRNCKALQVNRVFDYSLRIEDTEANDRGETETSPNLPYSKLSHSLEDNAFSFKSITEPNERNFVRPLFSESNLQYNSNNSNSKVLGPIDKRYSNPFMTGHIQSFIPSSNRNKETCLLSTPYSSSKVPQGNNFNSNEDFNDESNENSEAGNNYNSCLLDYIARVSTNDSAESNHSARYNNSIEISINPPLFSRNTEVRTSNEDLSRLRKYEQPSMSTNEGYLNAFKKKKMLCWANTSRQNFMSNTVKAKKPPMLANSTDSLSTSGQLTALKGEKQPINLDNIAAGKDTRSTVMIRNIPIKYTDKMLIKEFAHFEGKYDCLYMPYDFDKGGNRGYAFINFTHSYHILYFHMKFQCKSWEFFESKKICELNSAKFQGISEIKKHANNYKGLKKPLFFPVFDPMAKLEVPLKYLGKIKLCYPGLVYVEHKQLGLFLIKAFR